MATSYIDCGNCRIKLGRKNCGIKAYDTIDNSKLGKCFAWLKHKIIFENGNYICKRCGNPLSKCH